MWIVITVVVLVIIYLFCIAPNTGRQEQMKPFEETLIAHRGLFNNGNGEWLVRDSEGNMVRREDAADENWRQDDASDEEITVIPENSMPAFEAAVAAGYGIELDTQTTADGRLVVFHDENLYRMCGVDKNLYECTYEELTGYRLARTEDKIPLFEDVLKMVNGRVPLVVEIKSEGNWRRTTRMTAEALDSYKGAYCMESFHPLVDRWFRNNRPDVLRGQLSTNFFRSTLKRTWFENIILTNLMLNFLSRPDFIAYNYRYKNQPSFFLCRTLFGAVSAAWTVRSEDALKKVCKVFDVIIFDSFVPEKSMHFKKSKSR